MAVGSISINGLLGGTAGKIDTDALVKALMAAKSMPKQQMQVAVAQQGKVTQAYQSINSTMSNVASVATSIKDAASWEVTKATSSLSSVVASSTAGASVGSTTFTVSALAAAQVSTVKADAGGIWVADHTAGIDIVAGKDADGNPVTHHLALDSGSVEDIAKAINGADIGVRAAVVNTDSGQVLQLSSAKTGLENGFSIAGMTNSAQQLTAAANAKVTVGDPLAGGYEISSASNTFANAMPGLTFTLGADSVGKDVSINVTSDNDKIASMVGSLVDSVNSAKLAIANYTGKGGVLQGDSTAISLNQDMSFVFSSATAAGKSLTDYGIDISKDGLASFDAAAFKAAYAADPTGTMTAIADSVAAPLKVTADSASAPVTGTISQIITSGNERVTDMNTQIDSMSERLSKVEDQLRTKYVSMQTALASLQAKGDWLTNMFKSMNGSSDDK